ncbi:radical SAM protein [Nonomuraea sp. NPDC050643]
MTARKWSWQGEVNDMTIYKQSKYGHVLRHEAGVTFFNSLTLEVLEGDQDDAEVWRSFEQPHPIEDASAATEQVLVGSGLLVPVDRVEERRLLDKLTDIRLTQRKTRDGKFSFLRMSLTERCNLKCDYCFVEEVIYKDLPKQPAPAERFLEHVEWLIQQNPNGWPTVQYFGGEPMLRWDLIQDTTRVLEEAVAAGRIAGFTHEMTTNGTLMTGERARWLAEHDVSLTISLDGWKEINDRHRVFHNGRGSYDLVIEALKEIRAAGGEPRFLITLLPETVEILPKIVRFVVEELGAKSVAVNAPQPTADGWEVDGLSLSRSVQESWLFCNRHGVEFHSLGAFLVELINKRRPQPDRCFDGNPTGTEAHWGGYVAADGSLSFCIVWHQDERVTTPSVHQISKKRVADWHYDATSVDDCDGCIAGMVCGGPCTLERLFNGGGLNPDRCKFFKTMVPFVLTQPSIGLRQ